MVSPRALVALVLMSLARRCEAEGLEARFVAAFPLKHAAVTAIASKAFSPTGDPSPAHTELLVTTFGAFGKTPSYHVSGIAAVLANTSQQPTVEKLEDVVQWTNYVDETPQDVFGSPHFITTAGGFLVPTKGTGSIDVFEVSNPSAPVRTKLSSDKKGWFYHKLVWTDLNGDGRTDILAARATAPTHDAGELVWLEHPAAGPSNSTDDPWPEHTIISGPDVDFIFEDLDGDGKREVIAAQFFSAPILAIYACDAPLWSDCSSSNINVTVIDNVDGPFFNVKRVDLNADGRKELLVTNNHADGTGSVFAYEQPDDYQTSSWTKHVISTGYSPRIKSTGTGSPGSVVPFFPSTNHSDKDRPWLLLSGDDGGFYSLLKPSSATGWDYAETFLCNSSFTVGSPTLGDVDGNGFTDMFLPFYADNKIEIYTFVPEGTPNPRPEPPANALRQCEQCLSKKTDAWCHRDQKCHTVDSPLDPCSASECASTAHVSQCMCTACNDVACFEHVSH